MEFNSIKLNENYSIHLPANSLLKMSGPSRYDFTHAIVARKSDYIQGQQVFRTQPRISLTFRKTKYLIPKVKLSKNLEISNVKNVYDTIAEDFSRTRWNLWPKVVEFIDALPEKITVADLGCGNGKYLNKLAEKHRQVIATDFSKNLLEVARNKDGHSQVVHNFCTADITYLPFRDELCEAAISIAVIHHLTDYARRRKSVEEILRILKPGGLGLITVWCRDQKDAVYADKEENQEEPENCLAADDTQNADDFLQVHKSRTTFKTNDMLVPWKLNGKTYHRYYHLFEDGEFEKLCHGLNCRVLQVVIDNGNYCCYIQKS